MVLTCWLFLGLVLCESKSCLFDLRLSSKIFQFMVFSSYFMGVNFAFLFLGGKIPMTSNLILPFLWIGSDISPERMKLYIEKKQPTAALMWENGSYCLLSQLKWQNFMYYCLYSGLILDQQLSAGIFFGRGNVFRGTFFRVSFFVRVWFGFGFFKCRLTYMVLLSGSLKGCYSLSLKSDSFSEPWRR